MEVNNDLKGFEYLILLAMIYMTIDLSSMVFAYKIISLGSILTAASSLIFPLTYSIMDIVAEVYGYKTAKKIILYGFFCDVIFAILVLLICQIPSETQNQTLAYHDIFSPLLRAVFAQMIGMLSGAIINIHLISKWKIMTKGKYFWLRSIGASALGEGCMLIISVFIALIGILNYIQIIHLIFYTYIYKIIFAFCAAPIINLFVNLLKRGKNSLNKNFLDYNPFNKSDNADSFANSLQQ